LAAYSSQGWVVDVNDFRFEGAVKNLN